MVVALRQFLAGLLSAVLVVPVCAEGKTVNPDFENHLIQKGGITIVYDGDGNRVSKTVAGVKTLYLVDTQNPTGYAQVIADEAANTAPQTSYVYGLERISERIGTTTTRFYGYDGHGSVRALTDASGNVTDTYDYDAFGNLIHSTGTTPNLYLYSGEQFDADLNLYYNRARYLNVSTGRFWNMDSFEGAGTDPLSLHKYVYASADPANRIDPNGNLDFSIGALTYAAAIGVGIIGGIALYNYATYTHLVQFDIETIRGLNAARTMASEAESAARRNTDPEAFQRVFGDSDPYLVSANYLIILGLLYKPTRFAQTTYAVCGCIAEAARTQQPLTFDLNVSEVYFKRPQFLTTDTLRDPPESASQGGAIVHEAAHSALNASDVASYDQALKLKAADAIRNADSYRIFAEHIHVTH